MAIKYDPILGELRTQDTGGSVGDATATTKGAIQLAGDLAGTAASPTVPGLTGKLDETDGTTTISIAGPASPTGSGVKLSTTDTYSGIYTEKDLDVYSNVGPAGMGNGGFWGGRVQLTGSLAALHSTDSAGNSASIELVPNPTVPRIRMSNAGKIVDLDFLALTGARVLTIPDANGTLATQDYVTTASTADRNRVNHTGTQPASSITGLATVATSGSYNDLSNKPDLSAFNDVVTEASTATFPATGDSDFLYIAEDTGLIYRWNGSGYTQLTDRTAVWGQVSGTLSSQTDLQSALNAKLSLTGGTMSGAVNTTAAGSAGVGTQKLSTERYVQSRGTNLVTNGTGLLKNNYNFSGFTFDPTEAYAANGSFKDTLATQVRLSDELIPVDPAKFYQLSASVKATTYVAGNRFYLGIAAFDTDGLPISAGQHMYRPGTTTTLAAQLAPGDTVVYLTSAANWHNAAGASTFLRSLVIYGYTSATGYTYPNYTYTRRTISNAYADGAVNYTANTVTLSAPFPSTWGTIPAGTAVANGSSGGTYKYIAASNVEATSSWVQYKGNIAGLDLSGTNVNNAFPPGTAAVKLLLLTNRDAPGVVQNFSNLSFTEVPAVNNQIDLITLPGVTPFAAKAAVGHTSPMVRFADSNNIQTFAVNPDGSLDSNASTMRLRTARTPASAIEVGNAGDICWDANYIYVCTATNTWKRTALTSW